MHTLFWVVWQRVVAGNAADVTRKIVHPSSGSMKDKNGVPQKQAWSSQSEKRGESIRGSSQSGLAHRA